MHRVASLKRTHLVATHEPPRHLPSVPYLRTVSEYLQQVATSTVKLETGLGGAVKRLDGTEYGQLHLALPKLWTSGVASRDPAR